MAEPPVIAADPAIEIQMTALHATRGANYWSRRPVTRMDVTIGAYEDISSAHVAGVAGALVLAGTEGSVSGHEFGCPG
jgi:hypothetical protein